MQTTFDLTLVLPLLESEKEQDDHFTLPGTDFPTAVALANQGPELKLLPHSVARASF